MSAVYIVLCIHDGNIEICETYPGFQKASERAIEIAQPLVDEDSELFELDRIPKEINCCWTFFQSYEYNVSVLFRKIYTDKKDLNYQNSTGIYFSSWQYSAVLDNTSPVPIIKPMDYPMQDDLPGGFSLDDKPIIMSELINDPHNVKKSIDLTDNQKWAIVTARIRKRPYFRVNVGVYGVGYAYQDDALKHLKDKTMAGLIIRDYELKFLDEIIDQEINKNKSYDCI